MYEALASFLRDCDALTADQQRAFRQRSRSSSTTWTMDIFDLGYG
ncbi:MAG: hypothetical protein ACRD0K_28620 [Egibacteraceae bacterium]